MTSSTNGVSNPGVLFTYAYDCASRLASVSSSWEDAQHPATLFSATPGGSGICPSFNGAPNYTAANLLLSAQLAINAQTNQAALSLTRSYDQRLRPTSETDSALQSIPPAAASVTVNVSGTEQSVGGSGSPTPATGAIAFTDSTAQVLGVRPLFAANSITLPDGYHVSFVTPVNTAIGVANSVAAVLNTASSPVTAVVSSGGTAKAATLVLTTKATGAEQNGPITVTLTSSVVKAAAGSLSGGAGTTYDTGSVTANVNGTSLVAAYGQASTPQTIAQGLASAINGAGLAVTANAGTGGALTVTSTLVGTAGNGLPVTLSSASDEPKFFSSASFNATSGTLGGGTAGAAAGIVYSYAIPSPGMPLGYAPNGNLMSYSDQVTGTWGLTYDNLNRVSTAAATSGPWNTLSLGWTYDSFGNRKTQTPSGTPQAPVPMAQTLSYPSKNQATALIYDSFGAGYVIQDSANHYLYDAEGRLCAVENFNGMSTTYMQYVYDAEGRRVGKASITSLSCNPANNGFTLSSSYVLGLSGEQISELDIEARDAPEQQ